MRKAAKIRLLLAVAILCAILLLAVASMRNMPAKKGQDAAVSVKENSADLELRGVRFTEMAGASTRWTLLAGSARYDLTRSTVALSNVTLNAVPVEKKFGEIVLSAPIAIYNTESRDVLLSGGVKAKTDTGMEFSTAAAQFSGKTGILTTSNPVSFSDGSLTVQGVGLEFNVSTYGLRIKSDVTTIFKGGAWN